MIDWHLVTTDTLSWPALGADVVVAGRGSGGEFILGGVVDKHLKAGGQLCGWAIHKREFAWCVDDADVATVWWADFPELPR